MIRVELYWDNNNRPHKLNMVAYSWSWVEFIRKAKARKHGCGMNEITLMTRSKGI